MSFDYSEMQRLEGRRKYRTFEEQTVSRETANKARRRMDDLLTLLEREHISFDAFASYFIAAVAIDYDDERWERSVREALPIARDQALMAHIPMPDSIN